MASKSSTKGNNHNTATKTAKLHYAGALEYAAANNLTHLGELITSIFDKKQGQFDMDKSLPDPFLQQNVTDPNFFVKWYNSKNESWEPASKGLINVSMPEYATLLAQIARDCFIMMNTGYHNLDNQYRSQESMERFKMNQIKLRKEIQSELHIKEINNALNKIKQYNANTSTNTYSKKVKYFARQVKADDCHTLLKDINSCVSNNYLYGIVIKIISQFLKLVSNQDESIGEDVFFENPHIIFPTYQQLNFQTVVLLTSAPICNFRLSNRYRQVHDVYSRPSFELFHDILVHGGYTHRFNVEHSGEALRVFIGERANLNKNLFNYYFCTDCTGESDRTMYDVDKITYDMLTPQNKKNAFALLLFIYLHELGQLPSESTKRPDIEHYQKENHFSKKYPFVDKLDWTSVIYSLLNEINRTVVVGGKRLTKKRSSQKHNSRSSRKISM